MSEVEVRESRDMAIAPIGTVVNLDDPVDAANALELVRNLENELGTIKRVLTEAIVAGAHTNTLELGGRRKAEIKSGIKTVYDADLLERKLGEAGMPEDRIRQIVKEEISYTVSAVELKRSAKVKKEYADAMEAAKSTYDTGSTVSIRKR